MPSSCGGCCSDTPSLRLSLHVGRETTTEGGTTAVPASPNGGVSCAHGVIGSRIHQPGRGANAAETSIRVGDRPAPCGRSKRMFRRSNARPKPNGEHELLTVAAKSVSQFLAVSTCRGAAGVAQPSWLHGLQAGSLRRRRSAAILAARLAGWKPALLRADSPPCKKLRYTLG